MAAVY